MLKTLLSCAIIWGKCSVGRGDDAISTRVRGGEVNKGSRLPVSTEKMVL